jgi:hypothetical protein
VKTSVVQLEFIVSGQSNGTAKSRAAFAVANGYPPLSAFSSNRLRLLSFESGMMNMVQSAPYTPRSQTVTDTFCIGDGGGWSMTLQDAPGFSTMRAKAIAQANAKVRDQRLGLAETLAEASKTRDLCVDTLKRVIDGYRAAKRGWKSSPSQRREAHRSAARAMGAKPRKAPPRGKSVADEWLQYRYAWGPLYQEVYGAMTLLWDQFQTKRVMREVRGRGRVEWTPLTVNTSSRGVDYQMNPYGTWGSYGSTQPVNFRLKHVDTGETLYEIGYYVRLTNALLSTTAQLGLDNPMKVMWELQPLSFVADWFVNVSDCLEQITAFTGVDFVAGWETTTRHGQRATSYVLENAKNSPGIQNSLVRSPRMVVERHEVVRSILSTPPIFGLHLDNGLNMRRMVDAIALARQFIR